MRCMLMFHGAAAAEPPAIAVRWLCRAVTCASRRGRRICGLLAAARALRKSCRSVRW